MTSVANTSKKSQEEVLNQFNRLRQEQRSLASKLSELQMDLNEHKLVIETLSDVPSERKCFRMIGGVLVERTVMEVSPALENNRDKISKLIETLQTQLTEKGKEINSFMEKHKIQVKGSGDVGNKKEEETSQEAKKGSSGILVSGQE